MPRKVTSLRIDEDLWKDVKILAVRRATTISDLVESLLRRELERT